MRFKLFLENAELSKVTATEKNYLGNTVTFSTGKPVKIQYMYNPEKSPNFGKQFQQHIEPHGRYMLHNTHSDPNNPNVPKWIYGETTFNRPLVIPFGDVTPTAEDYYGPGGWKNILYQVYGVGGAALTQKLRGEGYDAIVTVDTATGETKEIVDLRSENYTKQ